MKIKIWTTTVPIGNWLNQKTDKNGRYLTYKSATFRSNEIDNSIQNNTYEKSSGYLRKVFGYLRKIFGYLRKIFGNIFGHGFASQNPLYFLKLSSTDQIYGNETTFQNEITMSSKRLKSNLNIVKQIRKLEFCMLPLRFCLSKLQINKIEASLIVFEVFNWWTALPTGGK